MSYYTAKYLREVLADVPDDEPVAGFLMLRGENETPGTVPSEITPEEWVKIVDKWEREAEDGFTGLREVLIDMISEVCSETDEEDE